MGASVCVPRETISEVGQGEKRDCVKIMLDYIDVK